MSNLENHLTVTLKPPKITAAVKTEFTKTYKKQTEQNASQQSFDDDEHMKHFSKANFIEREKKQK